MGFGGGPKTLEIGNDAAMTIPPRGIHERKLKRLIFRGFRKVETNET
jgi:hypothetical protein